MAFGLRKASRWHWLCTLAAPALPAAAQTVPVAEEPAPSSEIVVTGKRVAGSAIGDVQPLAVLDAEAMKSLGATTMKEMLTRLRGLASGPDGSPPIILLNGRRISGFEELYALPPEAMERTEVLPPQEAVRFGYPPTANVMNFITKKRFRAITVQEMAGGTTDGGAGTAFTEIGSTRIDGPRRLTLNTSHFHQDPLLQSRRPIGPDPAVLFALGGTVTAPGGGSIDPALDALAGQPVTVAPLPADAAARGALPDYAAAANRSVPTDIGDYRTLVQRSDTIRVDGTLASPIGKTVSGSLNLNMEARRSSGLNGLATALLTVPPGGPLPFAAPVLVSRYLPDTPLRQRHTGLTLHAGGTVQGQLASWTWNATGTYDHVRAAAVSERGVPVAALQAAVSAGADPLVPLDPVTARQRLVNRSTTRTGTIVGKAVASGPLVRLPAGTAQLVVTADYARSSASGRQPGTPTAALDLTRTTRGASVAASLPIAAADEQVLGFMGRLAADAMVGVSDVSDFGRLVSSNLGLTWTPARRVQLRASVNTSQSPPAITLLTGPVLASPNTPFFDFTTGTSALVTVVSGGNPALAPERRQIMTLGVGVQPVKGKELRLNLDYVETRIDDQIAYLGNVTPALQRAFPDAFLRDAAGRLLRVDLRPTNLARERDRQLRATFNLSTPLGKAPPPPPAAAPGATAKDAPPPPPPRRRPYLYTTMTTTYRLDNRLVLRPGFVPLDLLDGDTLDGSGGRPRWEVELNLNLGLGPANIGTFSRLQGPTRIRSDLAASDLRFSGRTWIVAYGFVEIERIVPRPWAKGLTVNLTVENLLNDRIDVRDRTGVTPYRFQPAFIDPVGRSLRLGVRKLF